MSKRVTLLIASVFLATACQAGPSASPSGPAATGPSATATAGAPVEQTLTVTTWSAESTGWKDWWPALSDEFEALHPGVTINVEQIAFADYVTSLTTRFIAGEGPELIHVPLPLTTIPAWVEAGFLLNLDARLTGTDIPTTWPDSQVAMEWSSGSYGVLMQDYGYVLFYNQAMLTDAGLEVPTSVDELVSTAETLTSGDKYGYAVTADSTINFLRDFFMFVSGMGAPWIDDGSWNFTDPEVVAAADVWRQIARDFSPQGTDISQKRQSFYSGNAAMMIEGPFILGQIPANASADLAPNLHVAQLPFEFPPGDVSNGIAMSAGLDPALEATAWELIQLIATAETMSDLALGTTSPVSRRTSNAALSGNPDREQVALAADNIAGTLFPGDATGLRARFPDFQATAIEVLHQLLVSDLATADVLADLQQRLEAAGITP